jgi:hypothetical protein
MEGTVSDNESVAGPRLKCQLLTEDETNGTDGPAGDNVKGTTKTAYLLQEEGKKSSFLLQSTTSSGSDIHSITAPATIVVENGTTNPIRSNFFLGGFQLVSTTRSVEVYLTDNEGKEMLLMTSKGIPFMKEDTSAPWHKVICVVPGGPRPISKLRIKLTSLLPVDTTTAKLHSLKLTARIPLPQSPTTNESISTSTLPVTTSTTSTTKSGGGGGVGLGPLLSLSQGPIMRSPPIPGQGLARTMSNDTTPITQSDLGAAMAGMTFIARSTEKSIDGVIKEQTKQLGHHIGTYFMKLEQQVCSLQSILLVQQQLLQQNHNIMQQQQQQIEHQNGQLAELLKDQKDLQVRVQALQADVSILRWKEPDGTFDDEDLLHQDRSDAEIYKHNSAGDDAVDHDHDINIDDDDDVCIDQSIPGMIIPLGEVCDDEESSPGSMPQKEGVTDEVNPDVIQLNSNPVVQKEMSNEDLGSVIVDETDRSNDDLAPSPPTTQEEQDVICASDNDLDTPSDIQLNNVPKVEPTPQKNTFHENDDNDNDEDTKQCNYVANIEVSLVEDESPSTDNDDDDDDDNKNDEGDGEKGMTTTADNSSEGVRHHHNNNNNKNDDGIHEKKEDDTSLGRAREQYYDSLAIQVQPQGYIVPFEVPPACWTTRFQCLPSTADDAVL